MDLTLPSPERRASPVAAMLRHEARLMRADGQLVWIVLALLFACGYALFNGSNWIARQDAAVAAARADEAQRLGKLQADLAAVEAGTLKPASAFYDSRSALWVGHRHGATIAALPREPLAATAVGQSDLNPPYVKVSADNADSFLFGEEIENPAHLLTGSFDLAFVVVFLLPLLVLALGHNLLSGEKEQGTLTLLLSNPVRLAQVLAAKIGVRFAVVFGVMLAAGLVGLAIGGGLADARGWAAFTGWAALVAGYMLFWFALAAWVNLSGQASATNALALVGLWIALTLVLPTLLGLAIQVLHPVPSRAEMVNHLRSTQTAINQDAEATLARFYQDHPEMDPAGIAPDSDHARGVRRLALQAAAADRVAVEIARYDVQLARQQALVDGLRFLSPAIVMQQALNDVAGTGTARYREFNEAVTSFHERWQAHFRPKVLANEGLTAADYARFPRFETSATEARTTLTSAAIGLAGLLLPAALLAWWSRRRLRRFAPV